MLSFKLRPLATEEFITATTFENLSILPSGPALEELQAKLESRYKICKLREALDALEAYDEIWIDTPPALHFYIRSALIAADACLIPFDCDEFARRALYSLMDNVNEIRADHTTPASKSKASSSTSTRITSAGQADDPPRPRSRAGTGIRRAVRRTGSCTKSASQGDGEKTGLGQALPRPRRHSLTSA
jgi:cellulose biosynthesis protein BcsQ